MDNDLRPSELKLERLREQGIVAHSPLAVRALTSAVILILFLIIGKDWNGGLSELSDKLSSYTSGKEELANLLNSELVWLVKITLAAAITCIAVSLIVTFFQTRFLFRLGFASIKLNRFWGIGSLRSLYRNISSSLFILIAALLSGFFSNFVLFGRDFSDIK